MTTPLVPPPPPPSQSWPVNINSASRCWKFNYESMRGVVHKTAKYTPGPVLNICSLEFRHLKCRKIFCRTLRNREQEKPVVQSLDSLHRKQAWWLWIQETAEFWSCSASRQRDKVQVGAAGLARTASLFKERRKKQTSEAATGVLAISTSNAHVACCVLRQQVEFTVHVHTFKGLFSAQSQQILRKHSFRATRGDWSRGKKPKQLPMPKATFTSLAGNKYWLQGSETRLLETKWTRETEEQTSNEDTRGLFTFGFVSLFSLKCLTQVISRVLELLRFVKSEGAHRLCCKPGRLFASPRTSSRTIASS